MQEKDENLEITGEALYWHFRYWDSREEIVDGVSLSPKPLISCTEVFLLDICNFLIAFSKKPRAVLRQLPWLRRMLSGYPEVRKTFYVWSSSKRKKAGSPLRTELPSVAWIASHLQRPEDPEKEGKNCQEILELISAFFRLLGAEIYVSGKGDPCRDEEFLAIVRDLRSVRDGSYAWPEEGESEIEEEKNHCIS